MPNDLKLPNRDISWNFAKFLVNGQTGKVISYHAPDVAPDALLPDIKRHLGE
jgi:glutathione peroxidase-family protein